MDKRKKNDYHQIHMRIYDYRKCDIQDDASKFLKAHLFTERLRKYADVLTMQEYKDLRQQALNGDRNGAAQRLDDILRNKTWKGGEL